MSSNNEMQKLINYVRAHENPTEELLQLRSENKKLRRAICTLEMLHQQYLDVVQYKFIEIKQLVNEIIKLGEQLKIKLGKDITNRELVNSIRPGSIQSGELLLSLF